LYTRADRQMTKFGRAASMHVYARRQQWRVARTAGPAGPPARLGNRPTHPCQRLSAKDRRLIVRRRRVNREPGTLCAGSGPASSMGEQSRSRYQSVIGRPADSSPEPSPSLWTGAVRKVAARTPLVPSACEQARLRQESTRIPHVCRLAADSAPSVAEHKRGPTGGSDARLVLGSLPHFSGVRALRPDDGQRASPTHFQPPTRAQARPAHHGRAAELLYFAGDGTGCTSQGTESEN
jgi:hypothetical protein